MATSQFRFFSMQIPDQQILVDESTLILKSIQTQNEKPKFSNVIKDKIVDLLSQTQTQNTETETKTKIKQSNEQTSNDEQKDKDNKKEQKGNKKGNKRKKKMSNNNKEEKKDKYYCRYYMQGSCKNGAKCKFTHPVDFPQNPSQLKRGLQSKDEPFNNVKKQGIKHQSSDIQPPVKFTRQLYFQKMIETMKQECYGCRKKEILVTLSCGCHSICELCVKSKLACSKENHLYDHQVYIK